MQSFPAPTLKLINDFSKSCGCGHDDVHMGRLVDHILGVHNDPNHNISNGNSQQSKPAPKNKRRPTPPMEKMPMGRRSRQKIIPHLPAFESHSWSY